MSIRFIILGSIILFNASVNSAPWRAQVQPLRMGTVIYITDFWQFTPPPEYPEQPVQPVQPEQPEPQTGAGPIEIPLYEFLKRMEMGWPSDVPDLKWEPGTPEARPPIPEPESHPGPSESELQTDPPEPEPKPSND